MLYYTLSRHIERSKIVDVIKFIDKNNFVPIVPEMPIVLKELFRLALSPTFRPFFGSLDSIKEDKKYTFNVEVGECVTCAIYNNAGQIDSTLGIYANDIVGEETISFCSFDPSNGRDSDTITVKVAEFVNEPDIRDFIINCLE